MFKPGSITIDEQATWYDTAARLPKGLLPLAIVLLPAAASTFAAGAFSVLTLVLGSILAILTVAAWVTAVNQRRLVGHAATIAGWILAPLMLVAFAVSPSGKGAILVAAAFGGGGIVLASLGWSRREVRNLIAAPLLVTSSLQAVLVVLQTLTDRAIGLSLVERGAELETIDGLLRAQGTMNHVYEPAALALLAAAVALVTIPVDLRWRSGWTLAAALAGSTVGLTHSRAALLGLLLMLPFLGVAAWRKHPGVLQVGGALVVGFAIAAALTASAWALRGDHSTTGDLDDVSLGRVTLAQQALEMSADHPLVGVGPGRYLETMRNQYELDEQYPFIVHNVSLAVAAENGIPAAVLTSLLIAWALLRAVRSGPLGAMLGVSLLGFLVFDVLHYDRPIGILMTALWLGVLQHEDDQVTSRRVRSS